MPFNLQVVREGVGFATIVHTVPILEPEFRPIFPRQANASVATGGPMVSLRGSDIDSRFHAESLENFSPIGDEFSCKYLGSIV